MFDVTRNLVHFLQGMVIGSANVIPGVSGGTMALIFGIYEEVIAAASHLFSAGLKLVRLDVAGFKARAQEVNWKLVVPMGIGVLAATVSLASIVTVLLDTYPLQCRALFFGLIAGSIVIPWMRAGEMGVREIAVAVGTAVLFFWLSGLSGEKIVDPNYLQIFFVGAVAISAMILPGVSGAFLLLVLGLYAPTMAAIESFDLAYIAVFGCGAAVGLGLFAKLLHWLLENAHDLTMAFLVGLMAGSLRGLWPWTDPDTNALGGPVEGDPVGMVAALAVFGCVAVLAMAFWERRQKGGVEEIEA